MRDERNRGEVFWRFRRSRPLEQGGARAKDALAPADHALRGLWRPSHLKGDVYSGGDKLRDVLRDPQRDREPRVEREERFEPFPEVEVRKARAAGDAKRPRERRPGRVLKQQPLELSEDPCRFLPEGGAARLRPLAKNARFAMTAPGWEEAFRDAKGPRGFAMLEKPDLVLRDREVVRSGDTEVTVLHTPGHTPGTASYLYDVRDGDKTRRAVTIGGLGLNAICDAAQLDAYIASMERLASDEFAVTTDMTAHPFSIGLTERIPEIVAHRPGTVHPLADREAYLGRLRAMADNARRLRAERFGKA